MIEAHADRPSVRAGSVIVQAQDSGACLPSGFGGLRLMLVGPLSPPAGGMAAQTAQLQALLVAQGAAIDLVRTNPPHRPAWLDRVPVARALCRLLPYIWSLWRAAGRVQLAHVMANSGWAWHLFAAPAIWIAHLRGVPVVVNYRGGEAGHFLARSAAVVRWTMRRAQVLAVPSGFLQQIFASHRMPATIVPNVVDLARFKPADLLPDGPPHLVVARNLERLYDNATALRAFAQLRARHLDARITIAGTGPEEASLRRLAADLGVADAVSFAGRLDRDAMAALYRRASVVINPSLADNMPNSVLEAMASGVPVVSTNVGGVPFLLRHEDTALLVAPGDDRIMAAALLRVSEDRALALGLRSRALAEVRRYTWEQVAPLLLAAYRRSFQGGAAC